MIQWFPGHMAKARREIEENLKFIDVVLELVDARVPLSSQNPMLQETIAHKPKLFVLMKADLADPVETERWLTYFKQQGINAMAVNVHDNRMITQLIDAVTAIGLIQQERLIKKGMVKRPIRALIVGIPNVGKSTLINRLANKKIAKIGDRPGITRQKQWIKVRGKFELLDTPGMLWPKFADETIGMKLAAIGTIKAELVPLQDVAAFLLRILIDRYYEKFKARYNVTETEDMWEIFTQIGKQRGAQERGGHVNFDKVANIVLQDFRAGKIGRITLDTVTDLRTN